MWRHLVIAIKLTLVTTVLLGLLYPLAVTGIAQVVFPKQANGSLIRRNGRILGSELIGQTFSKPEYFHVRPSAAFDPRHSKDQKTPQDTYVSSGSNLGPTSRALVDRVRTDVGRAVKENPGLTRGRVPADMVTTSASGLDPDISPANAYAQGARVARARGMTVSSVNTLIRDHTTDRQFGILGEPRVNVLKLNLALDEQQPTARKPQP